MGQCLGHLGQFGDDGQGPPGFGACGEGERTAHGLPHAVAVTDVVTFLLSDRASWVNGAADIAVDGAQGRPSANGY